MATQNNPMSTLEKYQKVVDDYVRNYGIKDKNINKPSTEDKPNKVSISTLITDMNEIIKMLNTNITMLNGNIEKLNSMLPELTEKIDGLQEKPVKSIADSDDSELLENLFGPC